MEHSAVSSQASARLGYTQYAQLQNKFSTADNTPENIRKAAEHFESVFINMWLQSAREANQIMAEDSLLGGEYMEMSQQMLDNEMANHLAGHGGIGLADVIVRQMTGQMQIAQQQIQPSVTIEASNQPSTLTPTQTQTHVPKVSVSSPNGEGAEGVNGPITLQARSLATKDEAFAAPEQFVNKLMPIVKAALNGTKLSPLALLSQAALETGWGAHVMSNGSGGSSHNLFGIKAQASDENSVTMSTREFEHGRWLNKEESFKTYASWQDSVKDYVSKITSEPRYAQALAVADNTPDYSRALQTAGYATDPDYADKIIAVAKRVGQMLGGDF